MDWRVWTGAKVFVWFPWGEDGWQPGEAAAMPTVAAMPNVPGAGGCRLRRRGEGTRVLL